MNLTIDKVRVRVGSFDLQISESMSVESLGILGSSGAGKTTLLEVIAGLRRPSTGCIALDGYILMDLNQGIFLPPEKRSIGYVPQDLALFPHLTVEENLQYGVRSDKNGSRMDRAKVIEVLELGPLLRRGCLQLSGGQRQRVALGRAVLSSPKLLLLDEPLSGLDLGLKERILPYLKSIRDQWKLPIIYVSHSPTELQDLCDHIVVLHAGRVIQTGTPSALFQPCVSVALKKVVGEA